MTAVQLGATICGGAKLCRAELLRKTGGIEDYGAKTHIVLAQPSRAKLRMILIRNRIIENGSHYQM